MVNCTIAFDNNPQGIYLSGQTLSGCVHITNEKKRSIKAVTLKIEGKAKCRWTESEGSGKHRRTITYTGREDYINTFSYLLGTHSGDSIDFNEGNHTFNFICALPHQLPTSLESKYGYIRYQIKIEIVRPWKTDINYTFGITVLKPLDLNYINPQLRMPLKAQVSKSFFLGFSSKNLHMSAEIPFCGYVSGQSAVVSISINNESNVEVYEVTIELMKMIFYNSDYPRRKTRRREERIGLVKGEGIKPKSKKDIQAPLLIPPVPPSNIGTCRTVEVFYEIHITARISGLHRNLTVMIPITIGTVPLSTGQPLYPSLQSEQIQAGWILHPGQPSTSQNPYPIAPSAPTASNEFDLPPPSYQQAMMSTTQEVDNDEGLNEDMTFNPKYPVFNFANQPASTQSPSAPPSYNVDEKRPL